MGEDPKKEVPAKEVPYQKALDLAYAILKGIESKAIDPKTLSHDKKLLCVRFLMKEQTYTNAEVANILDVSEVTIYRYKKIIREESGLFKLIMDESDIALDMIETANHSIARLKKQGKHRDAWSVKKECIEMLQTLGYVKKQKLEVDLSGKVSLIEILDLAKKSNDTETREGEEIIDGKSRALGESLGRSVEEEE